MNKVLDFMGKDHDRLDGIFKGFQALKNSNYSKAKNLFSEFKIGLQRHIVWEEEILFPLFENKNGMQGGPTTVMREEHRQIKDFLQEIHDKVAKKDTKTNDLESGLLNVLKSHNEKEETILYPWIDDSLSESEIKEAFNKMEGLPPEKYNRCCE